MMNIYLPALLVLFLSACTQKTTHTAKQVGTLTTFTEGDYEITQVAKELSSALSIPLHQQSLDYTQNCALDEITLIKVDNALCLILNGMIFEPNAAKPIENAIYIVQEITDILIKYPHIVIQVTGHTDRNEKNNHHQDLSDNRAITVAEILYKLEAKNETYAKGCADKKPLFSKTVDEKGISNARVEIYLYGNKEKMVDHCL